SPWYSVVTGFCGVSGGRSAKATLLSATAATVASDDRKRFALMEEDQRPERLSCKKILLRSGRRRRRRRRCHVLRILYLVADRCVQFLYCREARVIGNERWYGPPGIGVNGIRGARLCWRI